MPIGGVVTDNLYYFQSKKNVWFWFGLYAELQNI